MSEWQPCRLREVHVRTPFERHVPKEDHEIEELTRVVQFVKPYRVEEHYGIVQLYRVRGCDAKRFFELRDCDGIVCEHEILTD